MAELDAVEIVNPTNEDFSCRYNGELYTLKAKERKAFAKYVAFHIAKHLSTKMLEGLFTEKERADRAKMFEISQLHVYDNPKRRIALYQMLGDTMLVQEVIKAYPFKGFIGEMSEYEQFVKKEQAPKKKRNDSSDEELSPATN